MEVHLNILLLIPAVIGLNFANNHTQNPSLQIELSDGTIQGQLKHTIDTGVPYYAFEGIPYAKPPLGDLRFRGPVVPDPWTEVLIADGKVPSCIQIPPSTPDFIESEDCLYINVYTTTPPGNESTSKAVMAWIYGGGFLFGVANSTYYGPDYLLAQDVILVHFNYRLNLFGFLSTGDLASPGNYGMKDQVMALKWIHSNIVKFGGDPQKVTIFGESAGGASVQYHLLSPLSRGLFQRAISESGSVLCSWAFQPSPTKIAEQMGSVTGFRGKSTQELIKHLRTLSTRRLKRAAMSTTIMNSINVYKSLPFSPTLEPPHEDAFLSVRGYELLEKGDFEKVPYILGFNSQESGGAQMVLQMGEYLLRMFSPTNIANIAIPSGLHLNNTKSTWSVVQAIKDFYLTSSKSATQQHLDFISDSYFYRPITESALLYSRFAPTYMYRFSYEGYYLGRRAFNLEEDMEVNGVMHAEEVWYLFARSDLQRANATDVAVRNRMIKLWTNFAKFGDPTPIPDEDLNLQWLSYHSDNQFYVDIGAELALRKNFKSETMEFWSKLFRNYGQPPFDTY